MANDEFLQVKQGPDLAPNRRHDEISGSTERDVDSSAASDDINTVGHAALTRPSTISSHAQIRVDNTKRPPPFSRKLTKSLFLRPADKRVRIEPYAGWHTPNAYLIGREHLLGTGAVFGLSLRTAGSTYCSCATLSHGHCTMPSQIRPKCD